MPLKISIAAATGATVEITGETAQKIIQQAAFWQAIPRQCPLCAASLAFTFRQPQEDPYYGLICAGSPAHEMNFGVHKANRGGGLYYDEKKWKLAYGARRGESDPEETGQPDAASPQPTPAPSNVTPLSAAPSRFNRGEAIRRIRGHWKVIRELKGQSDDFRIALDKCADAELVEVGKRAKATAQSLIERNSARREQAR